MADRKDIKPLMRHLTVRREFSLMRSKYSLQPSENLDCPRPVNVYSYVKKAEIFGTLIHGYERRSPDIFGFEK